MRRLRRQKLGHAHCIGAPRNARARPNGSRATAHSNMSVRTSSVPFTFKFMRPSRLRAGALGTLALVACSGTYLGSTPPDAGPSTADASSPPPDALVVGSGDSSPPADDAGLDALADTGPSSPCLRPNLFVTTSTMATAASEPSGPRSRPLSAPSTSMGLLLSLERGRYAFS